MAKAQAKPAKKPAKAKPAPPKKPSFEGHTIEIDADLFVEAIGLGRDILVISCRTYKGKQALDLRQYYLPSGEGAYKPTGKGVWIPPDVVEMVLDTLAEHRDAIAQALDL